MITNAFDLEEQNPDIRILCPPVPNHNHPDNMDVISSSAVKQKMVEKLVADPSKPIKRVYDEVVADTVDHDQVPEFSHVRSKLNRKRVSLFPLIPNDVEDVNTENERAETWGGSGFLSHQDNEWGVLVFGTDGNFSKLRRCPDVYIDYTFKVAQGPMSTL